MTQSNFDKIRSKPFWYLDSTKHKEKDNQQRNHCCFNHIIGLPKKDGKSKTSL